MNRNIVFFFKYSFRNIKQDHQSIESFFFLNSQVRGLSNQGKDSESSSETSSQQSNTPATPTTPTKQQAPIQNVKMEPPLSIDSDNSTFLECTPTIESPQTAPSQAAAPSATQNTDSSNMEHTEALQHLEKALNACEATLTETPGLVKMEPDEQFSQDPKPYTISMVRTTNCTPGSPFPAIEGKYDQIFGKFFDID